MKALKIQKAGLMFDRKFVCIYVLLLLPFGSTLYGYGGSEHTDITQKAIANYQAWVAADPVDRVGANAVGRNWIDIVNGAVEEDDIEIEDPAPWREHYMDPVTGLGLWLGLRFRSAYERATDEHHWYAALDSYEDGDYPMAYWSLGRVMHLTQDMGVPAHVQLDPHVGFEWYEKEYILTHHMVETNISNLDSVDSLLNIMYPLAHMSDQFDSHGDLGIVDGTTDKVNAHDGWTDCEGFAIASECYTGAIRAAGDVVRKFIHVVKPSVELLRPSSEGEIHSEIIGVPLKAQAKSYKKDFTEPYHIQKVEFSYSELGAPAPDD